MSTFFRVQSQGNETCKGHKGCLVGSLKTLPLSLQVSSFSFFATTFHNYSEMLHKQTYVHMECFQEKRWIRWHKLKPYFLARKPTSYNRHQNTAAFSTSICQDPYARIFCRTNIKVNMDQPNSIPPLLSIICSPFLLQRLWTTCIARWPLFSVKTEVLRGIVRGRESILLFP